MQFSIIIPTYNHCDDLLKPCVESILQYTHMSHVELIISANGCTDHTREYVHSLQQKFSDLGFPNHVKLIWHDDALGFSRAVNAGIRASQGEYVILLNNDVILLPQHRGDWLHRLHAPFKTDSRVGITSTLQLYSPQTGRDFAVFFCTMIARQLIDHIGMLDESFGVGAGEDIEYCFRAEQAGYLVKSVAKTRYNSQAGTNVSDFPIWHKAEGTMHDPELVPNWHELFAANIQMLAHRFTPVKLVDHVQELTLKFPQWRNTDTETQNLFDEIFQNNGYQLTAEHMRNKEVIDVGANVGFFSIAAAALGAHKVLSFEPVTVSHERLHNHVVSCGLHDRIHIHKQAVMGKPQDPMLMGLHDRHGANSLYKPGDMCELVQVTTLEHIMQQTHSNNVILKLDCEGAEFDILMDTPDHVFDRIKHIIVEIHVNLHPIHNDRHVIEQRLTGLGFTCSSSKNIGMYWYDAQGQIVGWDPGLFFIDTWHK